MKKTACFILIVLFFFKNSAISQIKENNLKSYGISISYWGNTIKSNGVEVGIEKYLLHTRQYKIIIAGNLFFEKQQQSFSNFGCLASSGFRKTFKFGLYLEYNIRGGYMASYYPFNFYKTNSSGEIVNIGHRISNSFVLGNSLGVGYDFSYKTKFNMQLFAKPNLYYRYPNNNNPFYLNNWAIEAGIIFHPSIFKKNKLVR